MRSCNEEKLRTEALQETQANPQLESEGESLATEASF